MRPKNVQTFIDSNIDKKSIQTLNDNLIQKDEIFNKITTQGFDSLYIKSNNKLTSTVNVDKPVNVETTKKNINISSSKTTNLDKSTPNCDVFTKTPELKENSNSKLNSNISKNVLKSSDSSTLRIHGRLIVQFMKCHMLRTKDLPFVAMIMSERRCLILFIKTT